MKKDLILNTVITFIIGILGFCVNSIFRKYLGNESLGLMRLFTQIIGFLNLAEMGLGVTASYSLYKPIQDNDIKQISIIMNTLNQIYKKIGFFIIVIGLFLTLFLDYIINIELESVMYLYWFGYILNSALGYSYAKYISLFNANQEYRIVRKIQGFSKIIAIFFQILAIVIFESFGLYVLVMSIENVISYYLYRQYFNKKYNYIFKTNKIEKQLKKDVKNIFWHKISSVIINNTDYLIITNVLSISVVAVYSSYLMVYQMLLVVLGVVPPVIRPIVGKYMASNSQANVYKYWKKYYIVFIFLLGIISTVSFDLYNQFVVLWMGKEYLLPIQTVILILINFFITIEKRLVEVFKFNGGFFDDKYSPILESLINLILSIILVKIIGLNGVILGTVISNVLISAILKPLLVYKRCFGKTCQDFLKDSLYYKVLCFLGMFLSNKIINLYKESFLIESWEYFIVLGILFTLSSGFVFLIVFLIDVNFRNLCKELIYKLKIIER